MLGILRFLQSLACSSLEHGPDVELAAHFVETADHRLLVELELHRVALLIVMPLVQGLLLSALLLQDEIVVLVSHRA